ncbi:MAG: hypothetical protein ACOCWB_02350 [Bacteroidota bacterium]
MKQLILIGLIFIEIFFFKLNAQDIENYSPTSFEINKYKGKIGNYPITMILTIFPNDSITGYYYYDNNGRFIKLHSISNQNDGIKLIANKFEQFGVDDNVKNEEAFYINENKLINKLEINGQWSYNKKKLPVILKIDNTIGNWRMLDFQSVRYYRNSEFHTQEVKKEIVFPFKNNFHTLNKLFLSKYGFSNQLINYINSMDSKFIQISQNFGENLTDENEEGCWSSNLNSELVFINDSIITYKTNGFSYCNNGYSHEEYKSYKISTGEQFLISNVFKTNSVDSVLSLLKTKYKDILQEHNPDVVSTSNAPYFSDYNNKTEIFLSNGGVYFRARLYKLSNYFDLYMSYKEIDKHLKESFKTSINCP